MRLALALVNFLCHFDWAKGWPAVWKNLTLDESVRRPLEEVSVGISRLSRGEHSAKRAGASQGTEAQSAEKTRKAGKGQILPLCLSRDVSSPALSHRPSWFLGF